MATVSLQSAFDAARRALDAGTAEKAVAVARYVLAFYPRNIEAQRLLGEALLNAGDAESAADAFGRVLDADPESVAAYYGRGLAYTARDDRMAAVRSFERALEIQPNLAELRTQLIRLYGEAPGSSPQLRLSRAGLARLYTRGGMYGQAVDEFRAIEAESDRPDVEAALAEALWRDGQEDEAAAYCRDTLERRPDLLKPRLLLGYLLYAGGQPEGEALWRDGAQQDPTLTVARALFDILPPIRLDDPTLPAFDADDLVARGYAAEPAEPQPFAQDAQALPGRPESPAGAELDAPAVHEPLDVPLPDNEHDTRLAVTADASLDAFPTSSEPVQSTVDLEPGPPRDMLSDDDLLASLLGIDQPPGAPTAPPRSLDTPAAAEPVPGSPLPEIEAGVPAAQAQARPFSPDEPGADDSATFSFDDEALDDALAQSFGTAAGSRGDSTELEDDSADFEPFMLDQLAYEAGAADVPAAEAERPAPWDEPVDTTAALADRPEPAYTLGQQSRSDEADAAPWDELSAPIDASALEDSADRQPAAEPEPIATRDLFSLDDLADDAASWEQDQQLAPGDEEAMPFSLADLGIDAKELGSGQPYSAAGQSPDDDPSLLGWEPYAPEDPASPPPDVAGATQDLDIAETGSRRPVATPGDRQAEVSSFSLADLGLTDEEIAALDLNDELADETQWPDDQDASPQFSPTAEPSSQGETAPNGVSSVFQQLEAEPDNAALRLAVARLTTQGGESGRALEHYRQLVRSGKLLDDVSGDLQDLIAEQSDPQILRRLHRLLGDSFMQQNRVQEAMDQYSWTSGGQ